MPSMVKPRHLAYAALFVVLMGASGKLVFDRKAETPAQRVYSECRLCGLTDAEIRAIIENVRQRGLTRKEESRLFYSTFGSGDDRREECMPCVEAILDVVGGGL